MKIISTNKGLGVHFYSLILASLFVSALARAHASPACNVLFQQTIISGVVSDASGTLPGVTIQVKGGLSSVVSDENGKYSIQASSSDVLVFSFTGFKTVEIPVNSRDRIDTLLAEDVNQMKEIEINAGYYTVKDKERTGSIARITSKDIETQPVTNVLATMQGRMAGVNVVQTTGVPGGGFSIQIRGRNSLRTEGNDPLYIIDGMTYSSESMGSRDVSLGILGTQGTSPLNNINPADIQSVEILKDADATAIYGSRGANGVVLITTRRGKAGKTEFAVNAYTGVSKVARKLRLLNTSQYLEVRGEAFANDGITEYPAYAYDVNGTWDKNRYTDWQDALIGGTAMTKNIDVAVSGGNKNTRFNLKGTNYNETTVFPGDFKYNKAAVHVSIDHTSDDEKFRMSFSGNYVADKNNLLGMDLTRLSTTLVPNAPALYDGQGNLNWENSTWNNPLSYTEQRYLAKTTGLTAGSIIGYKLLPELEAYVNLGYAQTTLGESITVPSTFYNPAYGLTSADSSILLNTSGQKSWNVEPQVSWKRNLGPGQLSVLVGATFQERTSDQLSIFALGFPSNSLISNIGAASLTKVQNNASTVYHYNAVFGRINYSLKDRYFLNLTGRRDGSSRFGDGNRFSNFGAVGAAWLFGNEMWVTSVFPALSFGKLRMSYGITGNDQIGDYQYLNTYSPSGNTYGGVTGLLPNRLYNPNFSWEKNKKLEMALETAFLKDRIFFTIAYYRNRSDNQLVGIPLPGTTGFSSIQANLSATVQNSGLEFELRGINFRGGAFNWTSSLNLSIARNKLVSFPGLAGSTYANQYRIGKPLGIKLAYEALGVDPQTGLYEFRDFNSDGRITAIEDRQKVIDTTPEFFGGLQNSLSYKNWQLDFLFQFVSQTGANYNATSGWPGGASNLPAGLLDRWQHTGDIKPVQQYTTGANADAYDAAIKYTQSTAAYSDASYIRLKNISLSYTLPAQALKNIRCRLYVQAQNLLTITHFKGLDPENQSTSALPPLRVVSFGTQLNF